MIKRKMAIRMNRLWVIIGLVFFLGVGCQESHINQPVTENKINEVNQNILHEFDGANFEIFKTNEKVPIEFLRAIDGDTIKVSLNGHKIRVRYLMIDTPESKKEGVLVQPFGEEAHTRNEDLLLNANQVYLVFDKGDRLDDYGRVLAYVYADNLLVSQQLIEEGLASVSYVNPPANTLESEFRKVQEDAKNNRIGIWSIPNYVTKKGKFNQVH